MWRDVTTKYPGKEKANSLCKSSRNDAIVLGKLFNPRVNAKSIIDNFDKQVPGIPKVIVWKLSTRIMCSGI